MTDDTDPEPTPVDPVFPRFFRNGEEPQHKLVGLIGYGLYEEARREWVDAFKGREGRYPSPAELRAYETSWTSSRLEGLKNAAVQILASYADSLGREIEAQALRGALKGGFVRSVVRWIFSAVLFSAAVLGLVIALSRAGVDPVGAFKPCSARPGQRHQRPVLVHQRHPLQVPPRPPLVHPPRPVPPRQRRALVRPLHLLHALVGDHSWLFFSALPPNRLCDHYDPVCASRDIRPVCHADARHTEAMETLVNVPLVVEV